MGGVYRDQGHEVVSNWLMSLLRPQVEATCQIMQEDGLLPLETDPPEHLEPAN